MLRNTAFVLIVMDVILSTHGQLCKPQDCIVNEWLAWSDCSKTCGDSGIKSRRRLILQQAFCGGKCDLNTTETRECNRKCCPQDCIYSDWTKWKFLYFSFNCSDGGERYVFRRSRGIVVESACGGGSCRMDSLDDVKCGHLKCHRECVLGMWSFWSACEGPCEQKGVRKRTKLIKQTPSCGADPCPARVEEEECIAGCCPVDCQLGEWSTWSECNTTCGLSSRTRTRFVQPMECKGMECSEDPAPKDEEECERYDNVDCVVSPWSVWSKCILNNGVCGKGTRNRTRTVVVEPECRGSTCPVMEEVGVCYGPCCRQDCEVSEWKSWSYCSTSCGHGIRTREKEVLVPSSCNGTECPPKSQLFESLKCEVSRVIDCQLSEWKEWSPCSENCGSGTSVRKRRLLTPAYCGGSRCQNQTLVDSRDCESYSASRDCVMTDWGVWTDCEKNCNGGKQTRFREISQARQCKGASCPTSEEVRTCHPLCDHPEMCNQGVCGCRLGYTLSKDGYGCHPVKCRRPSIKYCPPSRREFFSCRHPSSIICNGLHHQYSDTCTVSCIRDWSLKGPNNTITCLANGTWSLPHLFCAPPNNPPHSMKVDNTNIKENTEAGYCVYLSTVDDSYDMLFYSILTDPKNIFQVEGAKLCLNRKTDFEEKPTIWNVTVRCSDVEGAYVDGTFQFEILNENDPPTSAMLTPNTVPENSMAGTHVGCFSARDDDPNQTVHVLLVDSEHKMFTSYRNGSQLCLKVSKESSSLCRTEGGKYCVLNMEEQRAHYVTLMAQDSYSPPGISYFNLPVYLTDVNDKPESVTLDPISIPEEVKPGNPLAALETKDEDELQVFQYELMNDDTGLFSVVNGSLVSSKKFNFEKDGGKEFEIKVKAVDNGTPVYSVVSTLKFTVGDVNEPPYDLHLTSSNAPIRFPEDEPKVKENMRAAIVGTIVVKDQDRGDNLLMKLTDDLGGRLMIMNTMCSQVQGINTYCLGTLVMLGSFDHEKEGVVNMSISVTDSQDLQTTAALTMEILDVNDAPSEILLNGEVVTEVTTPENSNGAVIAELTAADDDADDTHSFSLVDSADGKFTIKGEQLLTSDSANLDFETVDTYTIRIVVKDDGKPSLSYEKTITVKVEDENEAPWNILMSANEVPERRSPGSVIGILRTEDPDNSQREVQKFVYSLENDAKGRVEVKKDQLLVKKSTLLCDDKPCEFDFETEPVVNVRVKVTDSGSPPLTFVKTLTLMVVDENEPPQDVRLAGNSIAENSPAGTVIGSLTAVDQDAGQTLTFTLLNFTDVFLLEGTNSIATFASSDYERQRLYILSVRCTDDGKEPESVESIVTVNILDVNEPPSFSDVTNITVSENTMMGEVIGTVTAVDFDNWEEQLVLSITKGSADFMITDTSCSTESGLGTRCVSSFSLRHPLDYETKSGYPLVVSVEDGRGLTSTYSLMVNVQDVNEAPSDILFSGKSLSSLSVNEMTQDVTIVELSALDSDHGQHHTFSIVVGDQGNFEVVENKLRVPVGAVLDFETQMVYRLIINVTDDGVPPMSFLKNITIQVRNVNEPPKSLSIDNNKVPENTLKGNLIGTFHTTDPDNKNTEVQTFTYELVTSHEGRFRVAGNQLQVGEADENCHQTEGFSCGLNYEKSDRYNVTILVFDNGRPPQSTMFNLSVYVTDVNDRPTNLALSGHKVQSHAPKGTVIGHLTVLDEDADQSHVFSLVSGGEGQFLVSNDGQITKATDDHLESGRVYDIHVKAVDDGRPHLKIASTFQIAILGVKAPVSVNFTSEGGLRFYSVNHPVVMENMDVGTVIGSLEGVNNGLDQTLIFSLETKDGETPFSLGNVSCNERDDSTWCRVPVKTRKVLDFEKQSSLSVMITVENEDGGKLVESIEVTIENVNEAPQDIIAGSSELSVLENNPGSIVTMFQVSDPDNGDTHTFTLLDDAEGTFILSTRGQLYTAKDMVIDFEKSPEVNITVQVADNGGLTMEKTFAVRVKDTNERPTQIKLSQNKVKEMSDRGTVIGQLVTEDPDLGQTHSYTLVDDARGRVLINGNSLQVAAKGAGCDEMGGTFCLLDYESQSSFDVVVTTQDSGSPRLNLTVSLTIDVTDVNDPPHQLSLSVKSLQEDTKIGTVVGTIEVRNAELDQTVSFSAEEEDVFRVVNDTLVLRKTLDYETQSLYNLTIAATDDGVPPATISKTFQIYVIDVNEVPFHLRIKSNNVDTKFPENKPSVSENSVKNVLIGQVAVQDYDILDVVTMETSDVQIGIFNQVCLPLAKMVHCTADLRALVVFDHEMTPLLTFELTAMDRQGLSTRRRFNLTVLDTNDPPTDINVGEDTYSVEEGSRNVMVTKLSAMDVDLGQSHSFTIMSESEFFHIVHGELWVSRIADLDYELKPQHDLVIRATDNGTPPMYTEKSFMVRVKDVNEAPTNIRINTNELPENSPPGTVIGELRAEDPDNVRRPIQTLAFTLTDSAVGMFTLNDTKLILRKGSLDYEKVRRYSLGVLVVDNGEPVLSAKTDLTIHVTDANDPPTDLKLSAMEVDENCEIGTVVGTLSAEDVDVGQSLTYALSDTSNLVVEGNKVKVTGSIDFEQMPSITFKATATDDGHPPKTVSRIFSVAVKDVNEAATSLRLIPASVVQDMMIPESLSVGVRIGTVEVVDPDRKDKLSFNMVDNGGGIFTLANTTKCEPTSIQYQNARSSVGTKCTVEIKLSRGLNFESKLTAIALKVQVRDRGGAGLVQEWAFSVRDTNEPPTDISIDGGQTKIPENEKSFIIGALQTTDEDVGDTFTYHVISNWKIFRIRGNKLEVRTPLDFEQKSAYTVTIKSMDEGGLSFSKSFDFSVLNVNEKPNNISLNPREVSNGAEAGDVVGLVTVEDPDNRDPDAPTQTHNCSVGGEGLGVFIIDNKSGNLKVLSSVPLDRAEMTVVITCRDDGTPPLEYSQNISLVIKETVTVPKEVRLTNQKVVPENIESFEIGEFQVFNMLTDKPVENEMYFYALMDFNAPFTVEGNILKTRKAFDFETQQFVQVQINAVAFGSNIKVEFEIEIGDVNEVPSGIGIYGGGLLKENSEEGTVIGDLNTRDQEKNQIYSYTIKSIYPGSADTGDVSPYAGLFKLQNSTMIVGKSEGFLNFEVYPFFSVVVTTTDSGTPPLSYTGVVRIVLQNVNDQPKNITLSNNQVQENSFPGTEIGLLTVIDEDKEDLHFCSVQSSRVPFKIKNNLTLVVGNGLIDFERDEIFAIEIECWDSGHRGSQLRVSKTFVINVTNVNEPPFNISLSSNSIQENSPVGQVLGELSAADVDSTEVIFRVEENPYVGLDGINTVVTKSDLDFEQFSEFVFTVNAVDSEKAFNSIQIKIKILDVNEVPTDIMLSTLKVKENLDPETQIATLTTSDPDSSQVFVYSNTETEYFKIQGDKLLTGTKQIDYEEIDSLEFTINSTDSGVPPKTISRTFVIEVEDVNEPLIDIVLGTINLVPEDLPQGSVLSQILVNDPDEGQPHVCQVLPSSAPFSVVTNENKTMELTLTGVLNYETNSKHDLQIKCTDGEFEMVKEITVHMKDINEKPLGISLSGSHTVVADGGAGYIIGEITVSDPDTEQTHVTTVKGPNSDFIKVKNKNLVLTGPIPLDVLKKVPPIIEVTVIAIDNGEPPLSINHTFILPITNVQIFAAKLPSISLDNQEVWEDSEIGEVIGRLYSINQTIDEEIVFQLTGNQGGLFAIKDNKYLILVKKLTEVEETSRTITVQVKNTETFETESQDITIFIKRVDKCEVNGKKCDGNARCVKLGNSTSHVCVCEVGFTGNGFTCKSNDYCQENAVACLNNGTCVNEVEKYVCLCADGFLGLQCEIPATMSAMDPCSVTPCQHGSVCTVSSEGRVICSCPSGWEGEFCERSEDDCVNVVCLGNGTCVDKHMSFVCECSDGRTGTFCQYQPSLCQGQHACENKEDVCIPLADSRRVICANDSCVVDLVITKAGIETDLVGLTAMFTEAVVQLVEEAENFQSTNRKKRQLPSDSQVYIISTTPREDGKSWEIEFVVYESDGDVYTRTIVYDMLYQACSSSGSFNLLDEVVCPSAMLHHQTDQDTGGFPIIVVAAAIGGACVLAIFVIIVCCVARKKRDKEPDKDQTKQDANIDKDSYLETVSRRSSGYASISKKKSPDAMKNKEDPATSL